MTEINQALAEYYFERYMQALSYGDLEEYEEYVLLHMELLTNMRDNND